MISPFGFVDLIKPLSPPATLEFARQLSRRSRCRKRALCAWEYRSGEPRKTSVARREAETSSSSLVLPEFLAAFRSRNRVAVAMRVTSVFEHRRQCFDLAPIVLEGNSFHCGAIEPSEVRFDRRGRGNAHFMLAVAHHQQGVVGDSERMVGMMGRENYGQTLCFCELARPVQNHNLILKVERGGGFIDYDNIGSATNARQK